MRVVVLRSLPASSVNAAMLARSVVTAMTDEPWFPSPSPSLARVSDDIAALEEANVAVLTRTYGTNSTRKHLLAVVRADFGQLAAYVQAIADANVQQAEVIVAAAGMSLKKPSRWNTPPFRVVDGPVSESVKLIAKWAGDRATYEYAYSLDGGQTWTLVKVIMQSKMTLFGLTRGQTYGFRCRVATKDGVGNWSDAVVHLVR
jgi:hypothetical protein